MIPYFFKSSIGKCVVSIIVLNKLVGLVKIVEERNRIDKFSKFFDGKMQMWSGRISRVSTFGDDKSCLYKFSFLVCTSAKIGKRNRAGGTL